MKLYQIPKTSQKTKKRLGRGLGSGRGKTSSRGMKGQKSRGKIPLWMVGGSLPLYKKLPLLRGWGNSKISSKPMVINLSKLNIFKEDSEVTINNLIEKNILTKKQSYRGVKILDGGQIDKALKVKLPVSKKAGKKIVIAGGELG